MITGKHSVVFMGTPDFAVPALELLANSSNIEISAVITQADKPAKRGQKLQHSPVKTKALELGLPVFQPVSLKKITLAKEGKSTAHQRPLLAAESEKNQPLVDFLNELPQLEAMLVVAYGKIIPTALLSYPEHGILNIHPSLLPRWRGAAPLQHTIFDGDKKSGVCLMRLDEGLDTGAVYAAKDFELLPDETFGSLHDKTATLGAELLLKSLPQIFSGALKPQSQTENGATYAEKWEKEDLVIRWNEPAQVSLQRIRASSPIPGARTTLDESMLKIYAASIAPNKNYLNSAPGSIVEVNASELIVATGESGYLSIEELQFPGKKSLPVREVLKGKSFTIGQRFS